MSNFKARAWKALSIVLVTGSAISAFAIYQGFSDSITSVDGKSVGYLSGTANVRTCPFTGCESSEEFTRNRQVVLRDVVDGEEVDGSNKWARIEYGAEVRYVHSRFVKSKPVSVSEGLELGVNALAVIVFMLLFAVASWQRGHAIAAEREAETNSLLLAVTFGAGIVAGIIGFVFARMDNQTTPAFLAGAFANVGAGLVGAAVTFVLFQVVLSRRNPSQQQMAKIEEVLREIHAHHPDAARGEDVKIVETRRGAPAAKGIPAMVLAAVAMVIAWLFRQEGRRSR
ncbi:hypothetical protein [Saccharothrix coeruleofusca]|uniref:Uncharacterized protein n=1 Tax=Saccharothrix coeruleofusca TaxID=33919 RepID=A0A918AHN0_9PSEU|nr:hypothetical protein [Saccharothrix coeruleofusca]MBP2340013.1 putative membrane protein YeaQ/YmgE (transglycosylase-associated protein family) [Saccharothrix coeruleofusca]GGP37980.1 hypothetical protein GCM10010185_06710 [Saccharothrix coeruleofusca]